MKRAGFFDPDEAASEDEKQQSRGPVSVARKEGLRRGSLRDFHSFRVTWVTLALTAGVPLEIVKKVTGHRTTEIVLKHYFQPGREEFRRTLAGRLPALLGGPAGAAPIDAAELRAKLAAMDKNTWKKIREELLLRLPAPPREVEPVEAKVAARRIRSTPPAMRSAADHDGLVLS